MQEATTVNNEFREIRICPYAILKSRGVCNIFMEQSDEKGPLFRTVTLKGASYQMDHLKRLSC